MLTKIPCEIFTSPKNGLKLEISNAELDDEGTYQCSSENGLINDVKIIVNGTFFQKKNLEKIFRKFLRNFPFYIGALLYIRVNIGVVFLLVRYS